MSQESQIDEKITQTSRNTEHQKESNDLISKFLKQVKKKLPFWLRGQPIECQSILSDIENHILDKAQELSDGREPNFELIKETIENHVKSPVEFARSFKKQGKPKFFISEEISKWFFISLVLSGVGSFMISLVGVILLFRRFDGQLPIWTAFNLFFRSFIFYFGVSSLILICIFTYLSMQGYIPEGFTPDSNDVITTEISKSKSNDFFDQKVNGKYHFVNSFYYHRIRMLVLSILGIILGIVVCLFSTSIRESTRIENYEIARQTYIAIGFALIVANLLRLLQCLIGYRKEEQICLFCIHGLWIGVSCLLILMVSGRMSMVHIFAVPDTQPIVPILCILLLLYDCLRGVLVATKGFPTQSFEKNIQSSIGEPPLQGTSGRGWIILLLFFAFLIFGVVLIWEVF